MTKATFEIEVESPYGKQPIEQFQHWIAKVSDEALTRWGIELNLLRKPPKRRLQIVSGDGSIMGEVEVTSIGASHTMETVSEALENHTEDTKLDVREVGQEVSTEDFE